MAISLELRAGKTLIVDTDNTTSEACVNNKKSRDAATNVEWQEIQKLLIGNHVNLVARRVTSKNNKADGLLRGIRSGQDVKHQVKIDLPKDLEPWLNQVIFKI